MSKLYVEVSNVVGKILYFRTTAYVQLPNATWHGRTELLIIIKKNCSSVYSDSKHHLNLLLQEFWTIGSLYKESFFYF